MNNLNPWTIQCRSVAAPHISSNGKLQKVLGTILSKAKKNCPPSTPWHDLLLDDPDPEVPIKRRRQTNFDLRYERLSKLLVHGQTMDDLGGVLSLYKDSVTCFCEVSLRSCESKKTIRLTDPTRSLPCPLLPSAALYCSLLPFAVLYLPFNALHCLLLPFTALYCTLLPLYCPLLHGAVAHKTIW